jgi:HTH-type transcriptional regulator/antitoxin HigA
VIPGSWEKNAPSASLRSRLRRGAQRNRTLLRERTGAGTSEADHFDLLALVIEDYERRRWPVEPPDAIDAIRYRMETGGYTQADLGRLLGSRQRASDILTKKRRLTMRMAWRLYREWGIPAEALIAPPPARGRRSAA